MRAGVFLLMFWVIIGSCFAQSEFRSKQLLPFIFFNHQSKKFTIIDDSTGCHEYDVQAKKWKFKPLTFQLEESFSRFLVTYNVLHEKGSEIFFVDKGCGVVYVLKNDTIKRHDQSKHHENQFYGTFFLYKGEPHIFGGYGLFQFKNIITRYDIREREWFCYNVRGGYFPKPRQSAYGKIEGDRLYISGGLGRDAKSVRQYNDVWCFDFSTFSWHKMGVFEAYREEDEVLIPNYPLICGSPFILRQDFFSEPQFSKNKQHVYELKQHGKIHAIISEDELCLLHKVDAKATFSTTGILKRSELFSNELYVGPAIRLTDMGSTWSWKVWLAFIGLIFAVLINYFVFFRPKRTTDEIKAQLSENEKMLLNLFLVEGEDGIEISAVNDIVSHDAPSADTLKKRRENLLKELRQKLAGSFRLTPEEVFIEEKHPTDKRIKILRLHQKIAAKLSKPN